VGFDAYLKRYFPAVVCLLIGLAAYFQASGMGQLVASSVAVDPSSVVSAGPPPRLASPALTTSDEHTTSAAPIIARNPFDSVTGPLDGTQIDLPKAAPEVPVNTDPYEDPQCDSAKVLLITQSEDPEWSFAAIAGSDGKPTLRRVGDTVGSQNVHFIGWDRVWLMSSASSRCQIVVGGKAPVAKAAAAPAAPEPATSATPAPPRGRGKPVPPEIASKIHKVSETEFNVERAVVDNILENQAELMRSARIVPEKEGDKIVGIRLFGIRPDSLLGTLGLENGDRLQSINGFEMSDPQKALEAYARLRSAERLTVSVNRRGKPVNIDFNIK
jgi:general secretion pathway protein C